jgi:catechol 2,3-dioxygenase-like lactoylglutathione lyase family enzyme
MFAKSFAMANGFGPVPIHATRINRDPLTNGDNTMPSPLPIESVNHIARVTRDLDASHAFYQDVLGFRPIQRPNFAFPGAWLFNYGVQIHLIATGKGESQEDDISIRHDHVAFHVQDTNVVETLLAEHGIKYRKNFVPDTGVTQLFFLDPDGNHIEIGAYPATPPLL